MRLERPPICERARKVRPLPRLLRAFEERLETIHAKVEEVVVHVGAGQLRGPRAIGQVSQETPSPMPDTPIPPPKRAEAPDASPVPSMKTAAKKAAPRATQVPNAREVTTRTSQAPQAGGGPTGGTGTDVANVSVDGIAFPYPGYLENIVRQIALRFKPRRADALTSEVLFLIRRDGTMTGFAFRKRSGSYEFDLEAQGAVEAAARSASFGALPDGFRDDVLTVIFSFDPQLIR